MTTETQQPTTPEQQEHIPFGTRLKTAREAQGLERKDAAAQLRLNEKIIHMMEKDRYSSDLPPTFIRGYLRAYGKLLQIPEHEIKKAIEPIKPKSSSTNAAHLPKQSTPLTSSHYFMQLFTYLIVFTMIGLVSMWWYTHPTATTVSQPLPSHTEMLPPVVSVGANIKTDEEPQEEADDDEAAGGPDISDTTSDTDNTE